MYGAPVRPAIEAMLTIRPQRRATMPGTNAWRTEKRAGRVHREEPVPLLEPDPRQRRRAGDAGVR